MITSDYMPFVPGYTKLFADIITSTIWQEPNDCRVLWITMLAQKEKDHVCRATVPWLAKTANISVEDCEKYLEQFQHPDPYSRSQEHEGRRIEKHAEGWFILNGAKYQAKLSAENRKEQVREAVQRHRQNGLKKRDPKAFNPRGTMSPPAP
jgi:hypothetical protein